MAGGDLDGFDPTGEDSALILEDNLRGATTTVTASAPLDGLFLRAGVMQN